MSKHPKSSPPPAAANGGAPAICDEIREVLFEYMTHELGDAPSALVREHLRRCAGCRAEAAAIKGTLDALRGADAAAPAAPDHLSADHRKRLHWAIMHPVLHGIGEHHRFVAVVIALVVIAAVAFAVRNAALFKIDDPDPGIPIWKIFKSGALPELVERERQKALEAEGGSLPPPPAGVSAPDRPPPAE